MLSQLENLFQVCISPSIRDLQETKCTLNFGSRAMKVTNTAYVNMEVDFKSLSDQLLKQLQAKGMYKCRIQSYFWINIPVEVTRCLEQARWKGDFPLLENHSHKFNVCKLNGKFQAKLYLYFSWLQRYDPQNVTGYFCFFTEDEIHRIRQNFNEQLQVERQKVKDETEEVYKTIKEKLENQQNDHEKEVITIVYLLV